MDAQLQCVNVAFEYPVYFRPDAFDPSDDALVRAVSRKEPMKRHRAFFVLDAGVHAAHPGLEERIQQYVEEHTPRLAMIGAPEIVAGGEVIKNERSHLERMLSRLHDLAVDRHAFVVAIGGGAVLDMVGYAAAITHRGVRLVRMPTTVLSQADSGVGVKNGVNAFGKKNFLGTFVPPFAVVNDATLLSSLSRRDRIAGMAEAVKVALVRDASFFQWISRHADDLSRGEASALATLVQRSCSLHLQHIATSGDPFELGSARPLDFGHWSAHKLETLTSHRLRHGEAVAIGMTLDALYSERVGLAAPGLAEAVASLLKRLGFYLWDDALEHPALLGGLEEFREHLGGDLTVTLLRQPGMGEEVHTMREDLVRTCIGELRELCPPRSSAMMRAADPRSGVA